MRRVLTTALILLLVGTWLFSLAGHLGGLDWRLDLASHFRVHYALAAAAALALAAALRRRRAALAAGLLLALEGVQLAPLWCASRAAAGPAVLRALHFNVLTSNQRRDEVCAWIAASGADLVLVQEVDARWAEALAALPGYEPRLMIPRADNFGIALLERRGAGQVRRAGAEELTPGIPAIAAELELGGRTAALLGVHTLPPVSTDYAARRDAQLAAAGRWAEAQRAAGRAPIVLGDLNASPFSAPLRALLAGADLVDSQRGFGLQESWPTGQVLLRIAIDHCLHDRALAVVARDLGPALGSDHLPLLVELAWADADG